MKRKKGRTQPRKSSLKRRLGRYKSGIEKECADQLSGSGVDFKYEEDVYVLQEKFRYPGVYKKMTSKRKDLSDRSNKIVLDIKYTPDFTGVDHNWVIECKGYLPSHHDFPMRWKLFLLKMSEVTPTPALFIVKNKQQIAEAVETIKQLIKDGEI